MIKNELLEIQNKLQLFSKSNKVNPALQTDLALAEVFIKQALRNMEVIENA